MKYVESPTQCPTGEVWRSLFLAGGITNCPDWQQEVAWGLSETDWVLLNPRRENFPIDDPAAAQEQITWEYAHLRVAHSILFWFPSETLCPIVLFELGAWSVSDKPLFVGVHPDYARRRDVEIQLGLARPDVEIVYSKEELMALVAMAGSKEITPSIG